MVVYDPTSLLMCKEIQKTDKRAPQLVPKSIAGKTKLQENYTKTARITQKRNEGGEG